jgi:hypothetical protein
LQFDTVEQAKQAEKMAIEEFSPKYNPATEGTESTASGG